MTKIQAFGAAVAIVGTLLSAATARAGEQGANGETQRVGPPPSSSSPPPRTGAPAPDSGWATPPAPSHGAPGTKSSSVTLKVSTEAHDDDASSAAPPPLPPAPRGRLIPTASSLRVGPEGEADRPSDAPGKVGDPLTDARFLHGFRIGYSYVANYDKPLDSLDGKSFQDKTGVKSPNSFLLGYEVVVRMVGHSWLNVILVGNGLVAGIEQSKFLPSGNALIGFEFNNSFQVGVGAHLTPLKGQEAHNAFAAGWTPRVGTFYVPIHAFFVPDVDGNHRVGMLTGVTF